MIRQNLSADCQNNNNHVKEKGVELERTLDDLEAILMSTVMSIDVDGTAALLATKREEHIFYEVASVVVDAGLCFVAKDKDGLRDKTSELKSCLRRCYRMRRTGLSQLFLTPNYDSFTDEEIFAELLYAAINAGIAVAKAARDMAESYTVLVKAAMYLQAAIRAIRTCKQVQKYRTKWNREKNGRHFKSCIFLAQGLTDLVIMFFPAKLAALLEYIGVADGRKIGIEKLFASANMKGSICNIPCLGLLAGYYYGLNNLYGTAEEIPLDLKQLILDFMERDPNSLTCECIRLGLEIMDSNFDVAIPGLDIVHKKLMQRSFNDSIKKHIDFAVAIAKLLCFGGQLDFERGAECAKFLRQECQYSPAGTSYLYAGFLFMQMEERPQLDYTEEIMDVLAQVPSLKTHFGGKKAFHEKFVVTKSKFYCNNVSEMLLPVLEPGYVANMWRLLKSPRHLKKYLAMVENKLACHSKISPNLDKFAYLMFMKGVMLNALGHVAQALDCFLGALDCEGQLEMEEHIPPQACFEIGLIYRQLGRSSDSKRWLEKANNYKGYFTETMIKFRVQLVLENF